MKHPVKTLLAASFAALISLGTASAADPKPQPIVCVSLMSETGEGYLSFRVGKAEFQPVKLGQVIPADAELQVTVDRDWAEFVPEKDPTTVYLLEGSEKGPVTVKVADLLKTASRKVTLPKAGTSPDPAFKDKLVAVQVMGRQIYRASPDTSDADVRYGTVFDAKGKVKIIGINNPLVVMFPNGKLVKVIGPLNFEVKKVLEGSSLYKYLNVTK